jgi:glucose 1-dehydrogenase
LNEDLVLGNKVVFGTVNAARRHYDQAAEALAAADSGWLARLITRRLAVRDWPAALQKLPRTSRSWST